MGDEVMKKVYPIIQCSMDKGLLLQKQLPRGHAPLLEVGKPSIGH